MLCSFVLWTVQPIKPMTIFCDFPHRNQTVHIQLYNAEPIADIYNKLYNSYPIRNVYSEMNIIRIWLQRE